MSLTVEYYGKKVDDDAKILQENTTNFALYSIK